MTLNQAKVTSGIPSLDKIIEGGFNRGDVILVAGQPGARKNDAWNAVFVQWRGCLRRQGSLCDVCRKCRQN